MKMELNIEELKKELINQDNMGTDNPCFIVFTKREYPTTEDYSYDRAYYRHCDGNDMGETKEELYKNLEDFGYTDEQINKLKNCEDYNFEDELNELNIDLVYIFEVRDFEQCFLTRKGAEDYLERNRHNLNKPFIFCHHMYRNYEMQDIRKYFMEFTKENNLK